MCIGVSAHQKLDLLSSLVRLCGYESVAVFGDCFDEVVLLDPVQYPGGELCSKLHIEMRCISFFCAWNCVWKTPSVDNGSVHPAADAYGAVIRNSGNVTVLSLK